MLDALFPGVTLLLGVLSLLYVRGCAALLDGGRREH